MDHRKTFVTLGMFIIDEFSFTDEQGNPTGRTLAPQIGGGGTYAAIGARIWLPAERVGMVVDKGNDFPRDIEEKLVAYGKDMWLFRDQPNRGTTRAVNSYRGEQRGFEYSTPRMRLTPNDLKGNPLENPKVLHFICSPTRASAIISELETGWSSTTVYEPIPYRCTPEELPALKQVLPHISILSPNAEEALALLALPSPASKETIERAADKFLEFGVGQSGSGWVIIRSGALGAYVKSRDIVGTWVEAFWSTNESEKVVDVTGAGNSFLGGLSAGLELSSGDVLGATLYASVSASFTIEQEGLPLVTQSLDETWNGDRPLRRLQVLRERCGRMSN
ncbi:Ribokinase-like protein [Crepidotus variabilis]|uniref:Ribokinase-like protein n=1 Tax=Crepidotus variabilis TaxID=179855 RepID=A0A9P6JVW0_9AGAR|nr:Ribokinase-like protein [Crepidotus variabilis]